VSQTYWVRGLLDTGVYTRAASTDLELATPSDHTNEDTDDHHPTWPGTQSDTTVDSGDLVLSATKTTGTYTSDEIDMGSLARWRIGFRIDVECENVGTLDWAGEAWSGLSGTWAELGDKEYKKWNYRSWDSELITSLDWQGNNFYSPTASWTLDATVYESTGVPGSFETFVTGEHYGRYIKFKITLNRESATDETIRVTACKLTYSNPP
jgi:hypothetical protein